MRIVVLHEDEEKLLIVDEKNSKIFELKREENANYGSLLVMHERLLDNVVSVGEEK